MKEVMNLAQTEFQKKVLAAIYSDLAGEIADHEEHLQLVEILRPLEGKKFTRRLESKLPEGWKMEKTIVGWQIKTAPRVRTHNICRDDETNNFSLSRFHDFNAPYSKGAPERREKLEQLLADPVKLKALLEFFDELNTTYQKFKGLCNQMRNGAFGSYHFPTHYEVLRMMELDSSVVSDVIHGRR